MYTVRIFFSFINREIEYYKGIGIIVINKGIYILQEMYNIS